MSKIHSNQSLEPKNASAPFRPQVSSTATPLYLLLQQQQLCLCRTPRQQHTFVAAHRQTCHHVMALLETMRTSACEFQGTVWKGSCAKQMLKHRCKELNHNLDDCCQLSSTPTQNTHGPLQYPKGKVSGSILCPHCDPQFRARRRQDTNGDFQLGRTKDVGIADELVFTREPPRKLALSTAFKLSQQTKQKR